MTDIEKVSNGLCEAIGIIHAYVQKQHWGYGEQACRDAIAMLQEQEAMKVQYSAIGGLRYGACPKCDARIDNLVNPKACGFCGQAVKWR